MWMIHEVQNNIHKWQNKGHVRKNNQTLFRMIMILEVLTSCAMIICDAHETLEFISIIII